MNSPTPGFRALFQTELPLIQAPLAGVQDAELAIAVCNAGGLGSLPCAMLGSEALRQQLQQLKAHTAGPYNLNFFCHQQPPADPQAEATWRELLAPYYRELSIDSSSIASGPGRLPFSDEALGIISEYEPAVVSFHFGLPSRGKIEAIKRWGGVVLSSATTLDEALWLEDHGADGIIAQGWEAGGHRGHFLSDNLSLQPGTFDLLELLLAKVTKPVIAAGGIATAEDVNRALETGAVAAQVGTAFLLCDEIKISNPHREALKSDEAATTAVTNLFTGRPARGLVNRVMRELGPINDTAPTFPLATAAMGALRSAAEPQGSTDFTPLWCGEKRGFDAIPAVQMVARLTARL